MQQNTIVKLGYLSTIDLDSPRAIQAKTKTYLDLCRRAFEKKSKWTIVFFIINILIAIGCILGYGFTKGNWRYLYGAFLCLVILEGFGLYLLFVIVPIKSWFDKKASRIERPHLALTLGSFFNLISFSKRASTYLPCEHEGPSYENIPSLSDLTCPTCQMVGTSLRIENGIVV